MKVNIFSSRGSRIVLGITALALGVSGFLPLFAGFSYEAALAAGLIVPVAVSIVTATFKFPNGTSPLDKLRSGLGTGAIFALVALGLSFLHGLRVQICDPVAGLMGFVLGPGFGALMAGAWGSVVNLVINNERVKHRKFWLPLVAFLGPLSTALVSVGRFYTSPMVFAYDPFVGYFAGPLYDTVLRSQETLLWYRLGSALTLLALTALLAVWKSAPAGGHTFAWRSRLGFLGLSVLAASLSGALIWLGPELGHYRTAASIRVALGRSLETRRCDIIYSRNVQLKTAELLGRECDAHVDALERFFGTRGPEKITVFLFSSPDEKGSLMGAAHTYIAKPWRREIYIQQAGYPHPVLGHELAHVVAGSFGQGPFKVAGAFGGWLPDPGRIEGFAVAASPNEEDELTLQEWAQTMQKLGLLPSLENIFRLGFLGQNSGVAYTVAGSFTAWLRGKFGPEPLRKWYGGAPIITAFGKELPELEREWRASLNQIAVSSEALKTARARFDQPSVFGRTCPHVVDELFGEAGQLIGIGDPAQAEQVYRKILELDTRNLGARLGLGLCADRRGDATLALQRYQSIANDGALHWAERLSAQESRADILLREGKLAEARSLYAEIARAFVDEDRLRQLDVKSAVEPGMSRDATVNLLIGEGTRGASWDVAAVELGRWFEAAPNAGLPGFLLGKNLFNRGYSTKAAQFLDQALAREIPLPRVKKEALRVRLFIACADRDQSKAKALYAELTARADLTLAQREALGRFARRCGVVF
ncbi:MAG: hypothetical protein SFV15_06765 [Polyangiaceae bacterium]|nr:hypothetical protein [Polyangiaceae bacterium]